MRLAAMTYCLIIPFCCSIGRGSHDRDTVLDVMLVAIKSPGAAVGTAVERRDHNINGINSAPYLRSYKIALVCDKKIVFELNL